jgi:hypothetical protein
MTLSFSVPRGRPLVFLAAEVLLAAVIAYWILPVGSSDLCDFDAKAEWTRVAWVLWVSLPVSWLLVLAPNRWIRRLGWSVVAGRAVYALGMLLLMLSFGEIGFC